MALSEYLNWSQYWYAGVSAVIGAGLGIGWAGWRLRRKTDKQDTAARRALREVLRRISELADQAREQFQEGQPNFPLETERASTICNRIAKFRDPALRTEVEGLLYQCSHYNAKLVVVNSAYMTVLILNGNPQILTPYGDMMKTHLGQIISAIKGIQGKLKSED